MTSLPFTLYPLRTRCTPSCSRAFRKAFGLIKFVKENFSYDIPDRSDFSVFPAFKRPKPPKDDKAKDDKKADDDKKAEDKKAKDDKAKEEKSEDSTKKKEEL
ncbi:hypothetical protein MRX96_021611 [Rhipicephalus microplus]